MGKKNNSTNNIWGRYHNGNYEVLLNKKTRTKIKFNKENSLIPDTIDNFDYKITQYCENNCPYCLPLGAKIVAKIDEEQQLIPIEDINIGDHVLSYNISINTKEYNKVIDKYIRPFNGDLICIEMEDGHILKLTPNHKVYTQRGYIRADELEYTDELLKM